VTHHEFDLSELLDALRAGEMTDTIRTSLEWIIQELIEAEATAQIGAGLFERTDERTTQRNGHRPRLWATKAGDLELKIPKLRTGSFFPSLLERRRRIDRALYAVVMEAWVHGVSTRKVDDLAAALGVGSGISKSEVSRICAQLDTDLDAFRARPLNHIEFPYVFADALDHATARSARASTSLPRVLARLPTDRWARIGPPPQERTSSGAADDLWP